MRTSWLIGALVTFFFGIAFTISIIGIVIGVPLIILSFFPALWDNTTCPRKGSACASLLWEKKEEVIL